MKQRSGVAVSSLPSRTPGPSTGADLNWTDPRAEGGMPDLSDPDVVAVALDKLNATRGELAERMGVRFTEIAPGRLVATMPVEGNRQPFGLLHGGASAVLAETLGSIAASLHGGPGRLSVGVDISATHHRAARGGTVTGVCTPLHEGRTTATYAIDITDADGRRICTSRLTCLLVGSAPGSSGSG
jgi:1,4-dihydroxy-2-naphthoyl-CoA hydrolase